MEKDFLEHARSGPRTERKAMIDRTAVLPVTRQCQILALSRSSVYYTPKPIPEADQALMRRIDELHLEYPFLGSRQIKRMPVNEGDWIGRKHAAALQDICLGEE